MVGTTDKYDSVVIADKDGVGVINDNDDVDESNNLIPKNWGDTVDLCWYVNWV